MPDTYLDIDTTTGVETRRTATDSSAGGASAGKIVALDGTGKLATTMLPAGVGVSTMTITASEALAAGDFVNIYNNAGTKNVRKANSTDNTKPAHGFVLAAVSSSASATVYLDGQNTLIAKGSLGVADVGKRLYLSTSAGGVTTTPPSTAGNIIQHLGDVVDVGASYVTTDVAISDYIQM